MKFIDVLFRKDFSIEQLAASIIVTIVAAAPINNELYSYISIVSETVMESSLCLNGIIVDAF